MKHVLHIHYLTNVDYTEDIYTSGRNILLSFRKQVQFRSFEFQQKVRIFCFIKDCSIASWFYFKGKLSHLLFIEREYLKSFRLQGNHFHFSHFRSRLYETLSLKSYSAILLSKYFRFFFQWIEINTFHYKSIHFLIYKTAKIREED